jgi:nucleoside-triphosphatase THEP1
MTLAYVSLEGRGKTDLFLMAIALRLQAQGVRLAGCVQSNIDRPGRAKCDMDLRVLPDGPIVRISEDRGSLARGCILDSGALEQTVFEVERRLAKADLLIINKFGKRESEGKGLVPVIAEAVGRGTPVLVGVNGLNLPQFLAFCDGHVTALPTDPDRVADWCLSRCAVPAG